MIPVQYGQEKVKVHQMAISKSRTPANIKVLVEESNLTLEKSDKDSNGRKRQRTKKKKTFQVSRIIKY